MTNPSRSAQYHTRIAAGLTALLLTFGCMPSPPVADARLKGIASLHIEDTTIGSVALVPSEANRVAKTLTVELQKALEARGYVVQPSNVDARLKVHIDYVRDQRVHHSYWWERRWPKIELYGTMTLIGGDGEKLSRQEVFAEGPVDSLSDPEIYGTLAPSKNLARAIAARFPLRR